LFGDVFNIIDFYFINYAQKQFININQTKINWKLLLKKYLFNLHRYILTIINYYFKIDFNGNEIFLFSNVLYSNIVYNTWSILKSYIF